MEETKNFADIFRESSPISKAAAIFFIIGKINFIPAAEYFLLLYILLVSSLRLC